MSVTVIEKYYNLIHGDIAKIGAVGGKLEKVVNLEKVAWW